MGQIRVNSSRYSRDVITEEGMTLRDVIAYVEERERGNSFDEKSFLFDYNLVDQDGRAITDLDVSVDNTDLTKITVQEKNIKMG